MASRELTILQRKAIHPRIHEQHILDLVGLKLVKNNIQNVAVIFVWKFYDLLNEFNEQELRTQNWVNRKGKLGESCER